MESRGYRSAVEQGRPVLDLRVVGAVGCFLVHAQLTSTTEMKNVGDSTLFDLNRRMQAILPCLSLVRAWVRVRSVPFSFSSDAHSVVIEDQIGSESTPKYPNHWPNARDMPDAQPCHQTNDSNIRRKIQQHGTAQHRQSSDSQQ